MSSTSKIEWTDATWNPVSGCSKVSQGCKNCYAERLWPKVAGAEAKREGRDTVRPFTEIRCHPERLDAPLHWRKPKRIFVNSMSDLFHEDVPFSFVDEVWGAMIDAPHHQYQILTKRPQRMLEYLRNYASAMDARIQRWPLPQVWLGVSVEDQAAADERIPLLLQTPAAVRFVSAEPLLGPIDLDMVKRERIEDAPKEVTCIHEMEGHLHWVITGGESGPNARPTNPNWVRSLRDQCARAGVAFFFKQWGEWSPIDIVVQMNIHNFKKIAAGKVNVANATQSAQWMFKIRKQLAGRQLDGRTHEEYPA